MAGALLREISKIESLSRYHALLDFLDITNLHFEPALKSSKSKIYHASNVIHTRIIDIHKERRLEPNDRKLYYQIRNHDGYKLPHYLIKSEQLDMKLLAFVQAMVPSVYLNSRKQYIYFKRKFLYNQLDEATDFKTMYQLEADICDLNREAPSNSCFNSSDFLHTRFWFFDLDYKQSIPLEDIKDTLRELNLFPYVNAIVQTSPTKYHIYIKSEMLATKAHVRNWPTPLRSGRLLSIVNPEHLENLRTRYPKKTGNYWFEVAKRGLPSVDRLDTIAIPIPEEAKLICGHYLGDDDVYNDYITCHKEISTVLGADLSVCNEMRNAQLVGYTNPKNGYTANMVYGNKNAPVLTTRIAKTVIRDSIKRFIVNYKYPFYVDAAVKKDVSDIILDNKYEILSQYENKKLELTSKSIPEPIPEAAPEVKVKVKKIKGTTFSKIPDSPEEYCRIHGLMDEVIWDNDINGSSNDMLLLFSRFSFKHIDLTNTEQQKTFFKKIHEQYFKERISKNLKKYLALASFFRRFQSICKHDSKSLVSNKANQKSHIDFNTSEELQEAWVNRIKEVMGEHPCIKGKAHIRLRQIICDFAVSYANLNKENNLEYLEFQIPASLLNDVHGYKQKLKIYEDAGLYSIGENYKMPKRKRGCVIKAGECKKHKLILKEAKREVVENRMAASSIAPAVITPAPINDMLELEAEPVGNRILTMDYVLSVVKSQSLDTTQVLPFVSIEKIKPVEETGYLKNSITDLLKLTDSKCEKYSDIKTKFKSITELIISENQQRIDHDNNDYLIKRAKILNNVRPFKKHEMALLSKDDRIDYLLAVADLVVLSPLGREYTHRTREEFLKIYGHEYFLTWIEQQVTEMTHGFKKLVLEKAKILRWLKRDLQSHIWLVDYIYTEKRRLHKEFLDLLNDEMEVFWRFPGSLLRDHKNRNYNGYLTPKLLGIYNVPVDLQLEECKYVSLIQQMVSELKKYIFILPYDHREKDSLLPLQTCKCESIKPIVEKLKDVV